jgi:hypothetical protein
LFLDDHLKLSWVIGGDLSSLSDKVLFAVSELQNAGWFDKPHKFAVQKNSEEDIFFFALIPQG